MNPSEIKSEMDELKPDVHTLLDHPDIWARIVSVLEEDRSYGSIAMLAVQSRRLNSFIGPVLKNIEKRVVLELDDLSRTPESKWGDTEYVHVMVSRSDMYLTLTSRPVESSLATS
jgi:hypothetical protein